MVHFWSESKQAQDSGRNNISVQIQRQEKDPMYQLQGSQAEVLTRVHLTLSPTHTSAPSALPTSLPGSVLRTGFPWGPTREALRFGGGLSPSPNWAQGFVF